jgi:hypothetical protein
LGSYPKEDEKLQVNWGERRTDLLARLLIQMGRSLGYDFDEVHVKKGIYSPEAHSQIENEEMLLRRGLIRLFYGDASLNMNVTGIPVEEQSAIEQQQLRQQLIELLEGKRSLNITNFLQKEGNQDQ